MSSLGLAQFLQQMGGVDAVGVEARAASFANRSIKNEAKAWALRKAIALTDLTTLEGADTPGKIRQLCGKALHPDWTDPTVPAVAAICVYPTLVAQVRHYVGDQMHVASVATAFPSGQSFLAGKLAETRAAVESGADEIDMVINRGAFLAGDYQTVFDEIAEVKKVASPAHLKVILETGELGSYDNVKRASHLAILAGADFIKTSTGKISPAATLPVTLVMLETVRDHFEETGHQVGVKAAGGISTAKLALAYLVMVNETMDSDWLTPRLFRLGASSLLNDLLMQISKTKTGIYGSADYIAMA